MKLEVGKYYRTAKDRKARVYATDGSSDACVHGAVLYENGWVVKSWFANGRRNPVMATFDDLVGKWKEPDPLTYRHYSHEELKTFIGKVVICKATGLPELIVGMTNKVTVRLAVRETPVTALDLLVMYEWEGKLPCGMLVKEAVGDGITDDTEAMQGRAIKRGGRDQYDPSNVDGVLPSFVKPDDTEAPLSSRQIIDRYVDSLAKPD